MRTCVVRRVSIPVAGFDACEGGGRLRVLLVTADADLRAAAAHALEAAGYDVVAAAHSGHALLACMTGRHVDLLAADMAMEDLSGPALAERLRRHCPDLRSVYLAPPGTPERGGILVRPFTRDELLAAIGAAAATAAC